MDKFLTAEMTHHILVYYDLSARLVEKKNALSNLPVIRRPLRKS